MNSELDASRPEEPSAFSVVKGSPTEEELAALVAVLLSRAAAPTSGVERRPSGWSAYWRTVRAPVQPGAGAWRMSGRPF